MGFRFSKRVSSFAACALAQRVPKADKQRSVSNRAIGSLLSLDTLRQRSFFTCMPKERNIIQEVLSLIQQLEQERSQHQRRIEEIDSALSQVRGGSATSSASVAPAKRRGRPPGVKNAAQPPSATATGSKGGRGGNARSTSSVWMGSFFHWMVAQREMDLRPTQQRRSAP